MKQRRIPDTAALGKTGEANRTQTERQSGYIEDAEEREIKLVQNTYLSVHCCAFAKGGGERDPRIWKRCVLEETVMVPRSLLLGLSQSWQLFRVSHQQWPGWDQVETLGYSEMGA